MDRNWIIRSTWFYNVNPALKFGVIAALFIVGLFIHNLNTMIWLTGCFFVSYLLFTGLAKMISFWLLFTAFILAILSSTTMIFFGKGDHVLFQWHFLIISEESLARGLHIGLRTFLYTVIGMLFATTTRPVQFFYSLMQQIKCPPKYAYGFLAAFRMLPIMYEEFYTIRAAMKVRGMDRKKGIKARYTKIKRYAIALLSQSIRRAQRTAVAMEAKRFSETSGRTYYYIMTYSRYDLVFIITIAGLVAAAFWLSVAFPFTPYTNVLE
ncbi:energy-coupling factor transport system permease protein [Scopulibacillus darangshiensis]|uniref:Energy-coupling factor transport system permease protein n=1 Tax=Scopulibacillus darangshiensis TaxID=442528 RepID=A0A4R2PCC7_9BACL|nr:energy-coupling factor transporter transmembrane component T [Scopulibacillus darangshiensis]TCP31585.1 energy-coupling factor transport system permease protein [Scopulibacillus darangshiensis]